MSHFYCLHCGQQLWREPHLINTGGVPVCWDRFLVPVHLGPILGFYPPFLSPLFCHGAPVTTLRPLWNWASDRNICCDRIDRRVSLSPHTPLASCAKMAALPVAPVGFTHPKLTAGSGPGFIASPILTKLVIGHLVAGALHWHPKEDEMQPPNQPAVASGLGGVTVAPPPFLSVCSWSDLSGPCDECLDALQLVLHRGVEVAFEALALVTDGGSELCVVLLYLLRQALMVGRELVHPLFQGLHSSLCVSCHLDIF